MKTLIAFLIFFSCAAAAGAAELSLPDVLSRAAAANPSLKVASHAEKIAAEGETISRSGYLPRIDFQGGYTAQQAPQSITTTGRTFQTQEPDYAFFNFGIYQTLYDFGRTAARVARARAATEATRLGFRAQEQGTFLQVVSGYFRILQAGHLLTAADEEVAQMTDHLRVARALYEEGVVTRNDVLQAEVRLASSRQRRLDTANRQENSWLALNYLTGADPSFRAALAEETKMGPPTLDSPVDEIVAARSEVRAQRKLVEESEFQVREAQSEYFPEIYARAGVDYVQNNKVAEQAILAATVGLKFNLFGGFATSARNNQAVQNRSRVNDELRQLEGEIALDYRTAVNDAKVAAERVGVTEASIRQGEENLRINRDRYAEQVGTATDVLDAQTLLTQIRSEHYQALFDYQVALARVMRARGEL